MSSPTPWPSAGSVRSLRRLQDVHRRGGCLHGEVSVRTGSGLAGWLGRRVARRMGIGVLPERQSWRVHIYHDGAGLHWDRHGADGLVARSLFVPVGQWPTGYWLENTGRLHMKLTVDVINGGWHCYPLALRIGPLWWPAALLPRVHAFKCIEQGRYRFVVAVYFPLLGRVFGYEGLLAHDAPG
jgi:hypothetical protein